MENLSEEEREAIGVVLCSWLENERETPGFNPFNEPDNDWERDQIALYNLVESAYLKLEKPCTENS